ncbi:MAG: HAMP domain-containing protein [Chloroflexi bacterium]|nr:HAMP domain-containing protein [Chloroflexota bacterium]
MRSLTSKLILAFLAVSLISIFVVVASTRFSTNREFDKFLSNQYETELATELARYYEINNTWDQVDRAYLGQTAMQFGPQGDRPSNFCVTDAKGIVVMESFAHKIGDTVNAEILKTATPIQSSSQTIGYLLIERPPDRRDPMGDEFIKRLDLSLLVTAIGTIILASIFGTFLSRTISRPIRELTRATHEMAGGKFGQQVPVRSRDEIGELASSFNKMNDDLARSFNLRKQMTADIAHELRTPLSLIIGHAEGVHDGVLPPSRENFEIIREEAGRLEQLVNDLRTLSLADAGELSMDFQSVEINKLLGDLKSHYMVHFNQKRIALDLEPAPASLRANLDPVRFTQVLTNILENALRYTPENGRVLIASIEKNGNIEIVIQDNGEGVSPGDAAHLFDRFYRADSSRTRDEGGSGLGLAIAKSIIEMHHGRVWAESQKGKGLAVHILLPS